MTTSETKGETRIELTPSQQKALTTILNLRKLSRESGTITTRAQNAVLRALNDADIAAVANALAN
jgi:cytochrome c553